MERGSLAGKIQMLAEMLGDPPVSEADLQASSLEALKASWKSCRSE